MRFNVAVTMERAVILTGPGIENMLDLMIQWAKYVEYRDNANNDRLHGTPEQVIAIRYSGNNLSAPKLTLKLRNPDTGQEFSATGSMESPWDRLGNTYSCIWLVNGHRTQVKYRPESDRNGERGQVTDKVDLPLAWTTMPDPRKLNEYGDKGSDLIEGLISKNPENLKHNKERDDFHHRNEIILKRRKG